MFPRVSNRLHYVFYDYNFWVEMCKSKALSSISMIYKLITECKILRILIFNTPYL